MNTWKRFIFRLCKSPARLANRFRGEHWIHFLLPSNARTAWLRPHGQNMLLYILSLIQWKCPIIDENIFLITIIIFLQKKSRMENIQSTSRSFFIFLKLPMTRRVQAAESWVSCILHVSGVNEVGKPEILGSNPTVGQFFSQNFQTIVSTFLFSIAKKNKVFFDKL